MKILYYYSSSDSKKIKNAKYIFANDRINYDIGISHLDSLNLIDIILELEKDGISINEEEAHIIFRLNEKDSTVAEIINNLLEIIKNRQPDQTL